MGDVKGVFAAAFLALGLAVPCAAGASENAGADVCAHAVADLLQSVPATQKPTRTARGDEAVEAVRAFLLSSADGDVRQRCARNVFLRTHIVALDPRERTKTASAYGDDAAAIAVAMLRSPDPRTRLIAARAAWGVADASLGRALLESARADAVPGIRAASFRNVLYGMSADLRAGGDRAHYETAIAAGLRDVPIVVAGAVFAKAGLDGMAWEPRLRTYASHEDPVIRNGAIQAYDVLMTSGATPSMMRFLAARLADPDRTVRQSVMLELFRMPCDAVPIFERFAATAPTADDREEALEYVRSLKAQDSRPAAGS